GEIRGERLEASPGEAHLKVLRTVLVCRDEGQVDGGLQARRKLDLGALGRLGEALKGVTVGLEVDAVLLLELVREPVHDLAVVVVAAKVRVTVGGLDLEHTVADVE